MLKVNIVTIGDNMFLLLLVHIWFTFRLRFVQRGTFKGIKYSFTPDERSDGIGTYRAFASALGTTIGPGNITGVAVAISLGGPGAVFWMWVSGILAMATKYAESYLSLKYAENKNGNIIGGTMVLLEKLGKNSTASLWALCCAAGGLLMGAAVPSNSLAVALDIPAWVTGAVLAFVTILTVSCGFNGIANTCSFVVPVMSLAFIAFSLYLVFTDIPSALHALKKIMTGAFGLDSIAGGGVGAALRHGVTRGLYSNESGLGTGGVLAAESGDKNITMSALASMTTAFWDTVVMCALTGIVFVAYGAGAGQPSKSIMSAAFYSVPFGKLFLSVSMSLFVFATVIGWFYIAKRALSFITEQTVFYDILYIAFVFFGSLISSSAVWGIADAVNIALLLPSVYALIKLSGKINLYIKGK